MHERSEKRAKIHFALAWQITIRWTSDEVGAIAPQIRHADGHEEHDDHADDPGGDGRRTLIGDAGHHVVGNDLIRIGLRFFEEALLLSDKFQPIGMRRGQRRSHG